MKTTLQTGCTVKLDQIPARLTSKGEIVFITKCSDEIWLMCNETCGVRSFRVFDSELELKAAVFFDSVIGDEYE